MLDEMVSGWTPAQWSRGLVVTPLKGAPMSSFAEAARRSRSNERRKQQISIDFENRRKEGAAGEGE